jgi:RimJ/RimL family protein N-acetyltransferase
MTAALTFTKATRFDPGTVYTILSACFAEILDADLERNLRQFDRDVFASPDTVGAGTLITSVAGQTVGLFSYDPRQGPQLGLIGYHGVLPPFRRRSYGRRQIDEIIRILTARRFEALRVTTSLHPFFEPACRLYEICGFREIQRRPPPSDHTHLLVVYQMNLRP